MNRVLVPCIPVNTRVRGRGPARFLFFRQTQPGGLRKLNLVARGMSSGRFQSAEQVPFIKKLVSWLPIYMSTLQSLHFHKPGQPAGHNTWPRLELVVISLGDRCPGSWSRPLGMLLGSPSAGRAVTATPGWIRGSLDRARRARSVAVGNEVNVSCQGVDDRQGLTREAAGLVQG